jgi:hypothetical protein
VEDPEEVRALHERDGGPISKRTTDSLSTARAGEAVERLHRLLLGCRRFHEVSDPQRYPFESGGAHRGPRRVRKRFDRVVVLGDLVGYGAIPIPPSTRWKLKRASSFAATTTRFVQPRARGDVQQGGARVGSMDREETPSTPPQMASGAPKGRCAWTKRSPSPRHALDEDAYIFGRSKPSTCSRRDPHLLFGHSHFPSSSGSTSKRSRPTSRREGQNGASHKVKLRRHPLPDQPGSIGQPRDGDNRASLESSTPRG